MACTIDIVMIINYVGISAIYNHSVIQILQNFASYYFTLLAMVTRGVNYDRRAMLQIVAHLYDHKLRLATDFLPKQVQF